MKGHGRMTPVALFVWELKREISSIEPASLAAS